MSQQYTDRIDRLLNSFATQSFRDQADRDYIAARLAYRAELLPQFLWSSHQAVEKYLKAILLYNRIKAASVRHDLSAALSLAEGLPFAICLSSSSRSFIEYLSQYGEFRYIDVPYHVDGHSLVELDLTVWEVRRYCQVLNVFGKVLPPAEQALLDQARADLAKSAEEARYKFRLHKGLLEKILDQPRHPSRSALVWQNASYASRKRSSIRVSNYMSAENPIMLLYPEMLDILLEYVFIPRKLVGEYREHMSKVELSHSE